MNIFYLDRDPLRCAKWHCDKHVVKMILEYAQLMSTAHRVLDGDDCIATDVLYKKTHVNHPSAVWVRQSSENYLYVFDLFIRLCEEYSIRYSGKIHATEKKLLHILDHLPKNIPHCEFQEPPLCMPDDCKDAGSVEKCYQKYYRTHKAEIAKWSAPSAVPPWWLNS